MAEAAAEYIETELFVKTQANWCFPVFFRGLSRDVAD